MRDNKRRIRTPHFIAGIGDGKANSLEERIQGNLIQGHDAPGAQHGMVRHREERLGHIEKPGMEEHWRDVFHPVEDVTRPTHHQIQNSGPSLYSAFILLGMIVMLSAIFLHLIAETGGQSSGYSRRRRERSRRVRRTRKKKTDESSDDEEIDAAYSGWHSDEHGDYAGGSAPQDPAYPYIYSIDGTPGRSAAMHTHYPAYSIHDSQPRLRTNSASARQVPNTPPRPKVANPVNPMGRSNTTPYKSPSSQFRATATMRQTVLPAPPNLPAYGSASPAGMPFNPYSITAPQSSGRMRLATPPDMQVLQTQSSTASSQSSTGLHSSSRPHTVLPTAPENAQMPMQLGLNGAQALEVSSNFSSFGSQPNSGQPDSNHMDSSLHQSNLHMSPHVSSGVTSNSSGRNQSHLLLSPGHADAIEAPTPKVGNVRRKIQNLDNEHDKNANPHLHLPSIERMNQSEHDVIPFMPTLQQSSHDPSRRQNMRAGLEKPPGSMDLDELKLVQMETGNSIHWGVKESPFQSAAPDEHSFALPADDDEASQGEDSVLSQDISIPSNDPRKSIIHKRPNLTMATDASSSLQLSVKFEELQLQEVIGGGGFGQVWKATWRGTPVAVKVLTGSAQGKHIAKAILEEFKAEINLLKGMRHPNICLYMGACLDPPNRAIITELAENGSVWDALRLPLQPPYSAADGTVAGAWPAALYNPGEHGFPPTESGLVRSGVPFPPKGSWPWPLVKRVACGAARGMAYLHSGNPPVLHRDLKSANLLLDESYTAKVCDFGLSRLKAHERSMELTGNVGTVQWMAPEVLANMSYNEKADVYSYGIICWELLSRECPFEGMTAIQCALAVLNKDKRPEIPKWCPPSLHALIKACVKKDPKDRPTFEQVLLAFDSMP